MGDGTGVAVGGSAVGTRVGMGGMVAVGNGACVGRSSVGADSAPQAAMTMAAATNGHDPWENSPQAAGLVIHVGFFLRVMAATMKDTSPTTPTTRTICSHGP